MTGVLFGLAPALQAGRQDPAAALYGARAGAGRDRRRLQAVLLASQVAISLTLLIGAGLFGNSLRRGLSADLGFNAEPLVVAGVNLSLSRYNFDQARRLLRARARSEVRALPGVGDAGVDARLAAHLGLRRGRASRSSAMPPPPNSASGGRISR